MPSNSLLRWRTERMDALDEIEHAHASVGGTRRGRRYATQQINYSYATLVSSHFQGYCRDLHTECTDRIIGAIPARLQVFVRSEFLWNRSLDRGNPHPGAIGSDFNRLGVDIWREIYALAARNRRRQQMLQELIDWRNAIAHQDFPPVAQGRTPVLRLSSVRAWRGAVNALADNFDLAMYNYLRSLIGAAPW